MIVFIPLGSPLLSCCCMNMNVRMREDPDCVFQALYNYDSMQGKPTVEQAMLAAMALYSAK